MVNEVELNKRSGRLSGAPDKIEREPTIDGNVASCPNCSRHVGVVAGRHLIAGNIRLLNRVPFRCYSCNERLVWKPKENAPVLRVLDTDLEP